MKAVVHEPGNRITVAERPIPEPADDQALVRVISAGLNRSDLLQLAGGYAAPPGSSADIPGLEFSGVVERPASRGARFKAGDLVCGITGGGAHAEFVAIPDAHLARVPDGADPVEFGGVPEVFITSHDALTTQARMAAGERVLIFGAGSGIGSAAIQLAAVAGCTVLATARSTGKLNRARNLGLTHGIPVSDPPDVEALAAAVQEVGGADIVLDCLGGPYLNAALACAALRARVVVIGILAGSSVDLDLWPLLRRRASVTGTLLRSRSDWEKAAAVAAFDRQVIPLFANRRLRPVTEAVLPFDRAVEAYDLLASNRAFGKVILAC